jgi:hypothetical protein
MQQHKLFQQVHYGKDYKSDAAKHLKVSASKLHIPKPFQKGQSQTCHRGTKVEESYTSTPSLTPALDGEWVVNATPRPRFTPGKDPVPILQESQWGPRVGRDGRGKSRHHRDSITGLPGP